MFVNMYEWQGVNPLGESKQGIIQAKTITDAQYQLRQQSIILRTIKKKQYPGKRVKNQDISRIIRQLTATITTGLPLVNLLHLIAINQTNPRLKQLLVAIEHDLNNGLTFSEALNQYPNYFNSLICKLLAVGEESCSLNLMMSKIAIYLENSERIKQRIRKALTYPAAVMLIAVIVTMCLLAFVVPQFASLYQSFGADLPGATRVIIGMSTFIQTQSIRILLGGVIVILSCRYVYRTRPTFANHLDRLVLQMPIIGHLLQQSILARFASVLHITYLAGLPLVDGLKCAAQTTGNSCYTQRILHLHQLVLQGEPLQLAAKRIPLFPDFAIQMIGIGEETGTLVTMLQHIATYYEESLEQSVHFLTTVFEPLIMALLGIVVGGLIFTMYLPILKLGSIV